MSYTLQIDPLIKFYASVINATLYQSAALYIEFNQSLRILVISGQRSSFKENFQTTIFNRQAGE